MLRRHSKELALDEISARLNSLQLEHDAGFRAGFWWGVLTGSSLASAMGFLGWAVL